jgi:hydroxyethylthiazole kinase-like uncharacterized protein yjeF
MTAYRELSVEHLRANPLPFHKNGDGKEARGRVLVIAGNARVPGAAILAGVSALRSGAGILQIATSASVASHIGVVVPEAMVVGFSETSGGEIDPSNTAEVVSLADSADAVVVGPGMMNEDALRPLVTALLARTKARIVLDAAAITCMRDGLAGLCGGLNRTIITPHAGEMARLLKIRRDDVEHDPLQAAHRAAAYAGVVVMKGAETYVVGDGTWRARFGSVALATSGSGDVLAGILGGILARGTEPNLAALWAVYLHGEAGRLLRLRHGSVGTLARELADEVPRMMGAFEDVCAD